MLRFFSFALVLPPPIAGDRLQLVPPAARNRNSCGSFKVAQQWERCRFSSCLRCARVFVVFGVPRPFRGVVCFLRFVASPVVPSSRCLSFVSLWFSVRRSSLVLLLLSGVVFVCCWLCWRCGSLFVSSASCAFSHVLHLLSIIRVPVSFLFV